MSPRLGIALLLGSSYLLVGCAASKYYDAAQQIRTKNPHAAIEYLALCLKEDNAHAEAIKLMDDLGKEIASDHAGKVKGFTRSKKYAAAVASCDRVFTTKELIKALPGNVEIYYDGEERVKLAELAAGVNYERGARLADQGAHKKAAIEFRRALGFVPGYKDAQARYDGSKSNALVRMAFEPFRANQAAAFLANDYRRDLHGMIAELNPEFLQVSLKRGPTTTQTLSGRLTGKFGDTGWTQRPQKNTRTISEKIGVDEQGNELFKQYDVTATWVIYTRKTSASLTISYEIKRADGTTVDAGKGTMKTSDFKQYASDFGGDTQDPNYWNVVPGKVKNLPRQSTEPGSFRALATGLSKLWTKKGRPVYKFAHKIYRKYK